MYRHQAKIPTIIAIFIVLFGIGGGILLVETSHPFSSSADVTLAPANIHITNISDSTFSVSWLTSKSTTGYISLTDKNSAWITAFDDRDEDGKPKNYITHHITIKDLRENTIYYFKIISGGGTFDNDGQLYSQTTGPKLAASSNLDPAYGVILQSNDKPAEGAIVYLTIGKSNALSTLVKAEGTWLIPLNNLRTQDLLSRPEIANPEQIQISVIYDQNQSAVATTNTKNDSPVPAMNLGKTYDFANQQSVKKTETAQIKENNNILGTSQKLKNVDLIFPNNNSATTIDEKPVIKGVGIPGKEIIITVNSTPQTAKITVGNDGSWSYTPNQNLPPGEHSVSISTVDNNGNLVTISRTFTVLKSGESVLGISTPSGTLVPTQFPTLTPILTFGPTATSSPPVTGNIEPTYAFLGAGIILVFLGLKFLLIS